MIYYVINGSDRKSLEMSFYKGYVKHHVTKCVSSVFEKFIERASNLFTPPPHTNMSYYLISHLKINLYLESVVIYNNKIKVVKNSGRVLAILYKKLCNKMCQVI